jgi:excisionase family DNA binding protein
MMNQPQIAAPPSLEGAPPTHAAARPTCETMSADEVAAFLGVDRKTVYTAANRNQIPHRRLGKRILFSRTALALWLTGTCKGSSESSFQ